MALIVRDKDDISCELVNYKTQIFVFKITSKRNLGRETFVFNDQLLIETPP